MSFTGLHYYDPSWIQQTNETIRAEGCVYGGTAAGVVATVKTAHLGKTVILLQPGKHLSGLTTGGLGWTDYGKKDVIGDMARQLYRDLGHDGAKNEEWHFLPSTAECVINRMVADAKVPVQLCQYLDKVEMSGQRISPVTIRIGNSSFNPCGHDTR